MNPCKCIGNKALLKVLVFGFKLKFHHMLGIYQDYSLNKLDMYNGTLNLLLEFMEKYQSKPCLMNYHRNILLHICNRSLSPWKILRCGWKLRSHHMLSIYPPHSLNKLDKNNGTLEGLKN